ncbi:MAG: DEAD/DEAH box helicase [Oligoflexus sp.]
MKTEHSSKDPNTESSDHENTRGKHDESAEKSKESRGEENSKDLANGSSQDGNLTELGDDIEESAVISLTDDDDDDDESSAPVIEELEVQSFEDLDLEPALIDVVRKLGWTKPTPVQGKCLPHTTVGKDVAGFAQTGTGKTGVFLITLANTIKRAIDNKHKGGPKAVILVPTRELAVQIDADARPIFDALNISSLAVYGGVDYEKQANRIKEGVDLIVATPGRLKDYYQKRIFTLDYCNQFVCDEADRMFDMGFVEDIEFFLSKLTDKTQKLLFSATTNDQVKELAFEYLENPEYISVNPEVMTPELIDQYAIMCESTQKLQVMLGLLREHQPKCSIIFTNTKLVAEWLHYKLEKNGLVVDLITGDLPQRKRISLISRIKAGEIKALIATDVASRGLHISDITHVYNFDLPNEASNYVHRIGRTARAGARGYSYSLVCEDYGHNLQAIKEYIGEQVPIAVEWYKDEYLQIVDQASNPYQDPEFKGSTSKQEGGSSGRSDRRPSDRSARGKDGNRGRKGADRGRGGRGKEAREDQQQAGGKQGQRSQKQRRGGGRGDRPQGDRPQHAGRGGQPQQGGQQNRRRRPPKSRQDEQPIQQRESAAQQPKVAAQAPSSIGGIFKKIVSVMFGRKSK